MTEFHDTYTFTARDGQHPNKAVTLTLSDEHAYVNLTGVLDTIGGIAQAEDRSAEMGAQVAAQAAPAVMKLAESISGPVPVSDLNADLYDDTFKVTAWQRAAGLRLAPLKVNITHVDNPEAAEAFIQELEQRKASAEKPGIFSGPLDYWLGWAALAVGVGALIAWPRRHSPAE